MKKIKQKKKFNFTWVATSVLIGIVVTFFLFLSFSDLNEENIEESSPDKEEVIVKEVKHNNELLNSTTDIYLGDVISLLQLILIGIIGIHIFFYIIRVFTAQSFGETFDI